MTTKFQYDGNLAEAPLPKVLATINRYRVPGVITAKLKDALKRIFLDGGRVVFATSNDLEDALGAFLVRRGLLTPEQLAESGRRIALTGKRQGEVLIDMGLLTSSQMAGAVLAQISAILWTVFEWEEGQVTFEVGRFRAEEKIQIDLPIEQVIRDGLMKVADPKQLVKRIGPSWTVLDRVEGAVPGIPLLPEEEKYLSLVDGKTPFVDLCRKGPGDAARNARLLFLFYCLDLIQKKADPSAKKIQWRTQQAG
jgi:hypothetical protein